MTIQDWIREFINEADQAGLSYAERDEALRIMAGLSPDAIVCLDSAISPILPISRPENGNCP
jgi:hypothetical protein